MKKSPIARGYKELVKQNKKIIPVSIFNSMLKVLQPYVYIVLSAKLLDALIIKTSIRKTVMLITIGVLINLVLKLIQRIFEGLEETYFEIIYIQEQNSISKKLIGIDFTTLESQTFASKVLQHFDEARRDGGIFYNLLQFIQTATTSIAGISIALYLTRVFWKTVFFSSGDTFFHTPWFAMIVIALTVATGVIAALISGIINKKSAEIRDEFADINRIYEYYRNMITDYKTGKEIRLFKQQPLILSNATEELLDKGVLLQKKIANKSAISSATSTLMFSVLSFGFYLIIGINAYSSAYSISDMVIFIGSFINMVQACEQISSMFGNFKTVAPKIVRYYEILDKAPMQPGGSQCPKSPICNIEFVNVSFRYNENSEYVLKNVNLKINAGDKIALVGENGAGKTTLIKLLCGLYPLTDGVILIDKIPLNQYDVNALRQMFSVVLQDYHIFSLRLGENVAVSEDYEKEKVTHSLEQVDFGAKHSLENYVFQDYDSQGIEISGGESQKIALARALFKDASFMIFDEPTSALDPLAEAEIYSKFSMLSGERTAIYISHRLASCRFCDKVAVLEHGKLVQFDTHDALIQNINGKYAQLWNAQAQYYTN
ncbi:MAG: ABC transporter ATP-binding protein [Acutalibacteraceae bacterium]|jgi:ATP-binding cassette subfamily B protein